MRKLTELQWMEKGYLIKEGAKGSYEWNNKYYNYKVYRYTEDEVYKSTEARKLWNARRNEQARLRRQHKKQEKEYYEAKCEELRTWHTAYQWLKEGKVPENAIWKLGATLNGNTHILGSGYYYCDECDVVEDPNRATELLQSFPANENYDGRPWW